MRWTPVNELNPAHFCGGQYVYCNLGHCLLNFAMTLTFAVKVMSVFHRNGCFPNFVRGILIKRVRKLHRQVIHDLTIVDVQLT